MRRTLAVVALPLLMTLGTVGGLPPTAAAQNKAESKPENKLEKKLDSKLVGEWVVRYERPVAASHGTAAGVQEERARIAIRQRGDSVIGEWQALVLGNTEPPPPREIRGELRRDSAFVQLAPIASDASVFANLAHEVAEFFRTYVHGMPPTVTVLEVTVRGDSLVGIRRSVSLDGATKGPAWAIAGVRGRP